MADPEGTLAGPQWGGRQTIAHSTKKKEPINIIFMRKVGRIYSAKASLGMLVLAGFFALAFAAVAVLAVNRYADLYFENRELRQKVAHLSEDLEDYQFQYQVLNQYRQLVSELKQAELDDGEQTDDASDPEVLTAEPLVLTDDAAETEVEGGTNPEGEPRVDEPAPPKNPPVDAVHLALRPDRQNESMRFQYNLQNVHPENKTVSGYLFIILTNRKSNPPKLVPYPEVEIKKGGPVDYKKGLQFSIRHGKTVRGKVENLNNAKEYDQAWIFAYSDNGELLMKKLLPSKNG